MPRISGVSCSSTLWCMRRKPRPRTVSRCLPILPLGLRTSVTRSFADFFLAMIFQDLLYALAALGRDRFRGSHVLQALDRGANQVDRVVGAHALGQHVVHAHGLEHGAHCATGDHTRTFGCRLHVDPRAAVTRLDRVPQSALVERNLLHVAPRLLHGFLDGERNFACLAVTEADLAVAVADHGQRGEAELPTALDHLSHTVDSYKLLDEVVGSFVVSRHLDLPEFQSVKTSGPLHAPHRPAI